MNISKQLHGWLDSLKNSDIKGVKFYTEKEKARLNTSKEDAAFDQEMAEFKVRHEQWLTERQSDPNAKL